MVWSLHCRGLRAGRACHTGVAAQGLGQALEGFLQGQGLEIPGEPVLPVVHFWVRWLSRLKADPTHSSADVC